MANNNYSRLYPDLQSDPYPVPTFQNRRSTPFAANKSGTQENPGRFMPNGNVFTRETALDLYGTPLDLRFAKVYQMLHRSDVRDVQEIFQPAVEAIFGFRGSSWNTKPANQTRTGQSQGPGPGTGQDQRLGQDQGQPYIPVSFCDITTDFRIVFEAGFELLNTDGPLLKFLLAVSPNRSGGFSPRFDFPVTCLPFAVQNNLQNGIIPPWYRDKIFSTFDSSSTEPDPPEFISLSAFDFYFAHFAYHLVNPDLRTNNPANPECLYMALIDNYSDIFFNANTIMENQRILSTNASSGFSRRSQSSLLTSTRDFGDEKQLGSAEQRPQPHPLATSECLESLINIFVEFWLNLSGFSSQRYAKRYQNTTGNGLDRGRFSPVNFGQSPLFSPGGNRRRFGLTHNVPTVFPPMCALQGFRQIVKAVHEFIYAPAVNPRNQKNLETSLLDMKRHIVPQLIQRPLYELLKTTMKKYPMDASFRYVYELWLTYIQPWRYENFAAENSSGDEFVINKEQRWSNFIAENLLFYNSLLQAFVDRMLRVDFGVPFNTLAIFRVTKVFREGEMYKLVENVEDLMLGVTKPSPQRIGFSPSKSTVRNHFADLEDTSFKYEPLKSPECIAKVTLLLKTLLHEQERCQRKRLEQLNPASREKAPSNGRWRRLFVETLKSVFGLINGPIEGMQLRPEELERMSKHISSTVVYLCSMFEISEAEITEAETTRGISQTSEFLLDQEPSFRAVENSKQEISRSRSQMRRHSIPSWIDEVKVPYLTEPEKRLPRSWEIEFLIPLLNALSQKINLEFGEHIIELYNGRDFLSRMLHPLIEPPHNPAISGQAGHRHFALPARINLRPLASKYMIGSLIFALFFIWILDFGFIRGVFWILALPTFFLIANALLEPFRDGHDEN